MVIRKSYIRAFKSIYELDLPLNPKINVLIGANESGKTNILKSIEAFKRNEVFDNSLTCQYSNHYYMGKCPEITIEFSGITKENRRNLIQVSEAFKDVENFQIRRDGSEVSDYHLVIDNQEVDTVDVK
ncbi:AAA family ATPase, partial [candidate division KSB1 bacterium]|nr:AAA family ATPase [candidate division KSB1 bacterium]